MDRSDICKLVAVTYTADSIGQMIPTETQAERFCNVQSVTRAEFFEAGNAGFRPELRITMFAPDYNGEQTVIYNLVRYSVYRTYLRQDELIELYLERKVGA